MIRFNNEGDTRAIAAKSGIGQGICETDQCIANVSDDGRLLGGVIYQNYTGASVALHMAGFEKNWCQRDMLWLIFHYPFVQLGCKKVFGQVPQSKPDVLKLNLRLGFKLEMIVEDVYKDGGMFLLGMYRDECKWLDHPRKVKGQAS